MRPRALVLRGSVEVAGYLLDAGLLGEEGARQRVLSLWELGCRLHPVPGGWLLLLPEPRRERAPWPGLPVLRVQGHLMALPPSETPQSSLSGGGLTLSRGGDLRDLPLDAPVDPAAWLEVPSDPLLLETLTTPPPPPVAPLEPAPLSWEEQGVPAVHQQLVRVVEALHSAHSQASASRPPLRARLGRLLQSLSARLSPSTTTTITPPSPSLLSRAAAWLRSRGDRLALHAAMGPLSRQHTRYLEELMERLRVGDLEDALRRAIPLGGEGTSEQPDRLAWRRPPPRRHLLPSTTRHQGSPAAWLSPDDVRDRLRRAYQSAAETLEAQGRVAQAAFVWADLLGRLERALDLLETHGEYSLAARLAESRERPVAEVIRLWLLAGEDQRGLVLARRHGAFAEAITLLEARSTGNTAQLALVEHLRRVWAHQLASVGDPTGAMQALGPVATSEDEPLLEQWTRSALSLGGPQAARALALRLREDRFDQLASPVLTALERPAEEQLDFRLALARALVQERTEPARRLVGRALQRALLTDAGRVGASAVQEPLRALRSWARDPALEADSPSLSTDLPVLPTLRWSPGDRGALAAMDAVRLPSGELLVALGEAGLARYSSRGLRLALLSQPVHSIVLSHLGTRAILVARRGSWCRLSLLDLERWEAHPSAHRELHAHARDWDGTRWLVHEHRRGLALVDTSEARWTHLWRVDGPQGATPEDLASGPEVHMVLWWCQGQTWEVWRYEAPAMRLRSRTTHQEGALGVFSSGWLVQRESSRLRAWRHGTTPVHPLELGRYAHTGDLALSDWVSAPSRGPEGVRIHLARLGERSVQGTLDLPGAFRASARLCPGGHHVIRDDLGRVIAWHPERGITADIRIGP